MNSGPLSSYAAARETLAKQYVDPFFPSDTGLGVDALEKNVRRIVAARKDAPRIALRAEIFSYVLENARIRVDPFDVFADHIATGGIMAKLRDEWRLESFERSARRFPDLPFYQMSRDGSGFSCLDLSHTSPGWRRLLGLGICGIRDCALDALADAKDGRRKEFLSAVAKVYEAIREYALRLAAEALRVEAFAVADVLSNLARRPPQSFREALQLSFLYSQAQEIEGEPVRTQGVFDQLYIGFYRRDLEEGRLSREEAKELVKFFFEKFSSQRFGAGHNICLGGCLPDGTDLCNELTELALEAFEERGDIDPKLSLRVHREMPEGVLRRASACVAKGLNAIVFANQDLAYGMFASHGKSLEDAIDFVPVGCYEPAIMGKELCCSMSAMISFPKVLERVLKESNAPSDAEELLDWYLKALSETIDETLESARLWERRWKDISPSPVMSGTMDSCLERGLDVSEAGAKYNSSGVMCAGIGTVADSIAAVDYIVFQRNICGWELLRKALDADWNGYEWLRSVAKNKASKWGDNHAGADKYAVRICDFASSLINNAPNARNGFFQMGCWSIDLCVNFGKALGATPDGRRRGEAISKNLSSSFSSGGRGVTALINSASKLNHSAFPDGSALDIMLHPSVLRGADGGAVVASLIKAYFGKGGLFIQFNVLDAETLADAMAEPERFKSLQVRVCGWNSRFVDLSREMQELFLAQARGLF